MGKIKELNDDISIAQTYKYVCQLELEKEKRKGGVYHHFYDKNSHFLKKIEEYDHIIADLERRKVNQIKRTFLGGAIGAKLTILTLFILSKTF